MCGDNSVEQILGVFGDRHKRAVIARITEQNIDFAPAGDRLANISTSLGRVRDVSYDKRCLIRFQVPRDALKVFGIEVNQHDLGTFGEKHLNGGKPDTAGAARYDTGLALN
jgi:hypothetical protein